MKKSPFFLLADLIATALLCQKKKRAGDNQHREPSTGGFREPFFHYWHAMLAKCDFWAPWRGHTQSPELPLVRIGHA